MDRATALTLARQTGAMEAARQLVRLGVDQSFPIDVYGAIAKAGVWLAFQPLKDALGAYIPIVERGKLVTAGILVNNRRPRSVQRLTAAHEYGHFVLKHEVGLDLQELIEPSFRRRAPAAGGGASRPSLWTLPLEEAKREAAAQAFATDFLMPPQLINALLQELDLDGGRLLEAKDLYLLSLCCGTSFAATVFQLVALKKLAQARAREILKTPPQRIKRAIGAGVGPTDSRADIWPLDLNDSGRLLHPSVNDEFRVLLPETPTSGYVWVPASDGLVDLRQNQTTGELAGTIGLVEDEFEQPSSLFDQALIGGTGNRQFTFRALNPGRFHLRLENRRPWQANPKPAATFEVDLDIAGQPTGASDRGLVEQQQRLLAA